MDRGEVLWQPPDGAWDRSGLAAFARGAGAPDDEAGLWAWSVADPDRFWSALRRHAGLGHGGGPALTSDALPGATWFPDMTWNYAEEALRPGRSGPAILAHSQTRGPVELDWDDLRDRVARARAGLSRLGVGRGDRVAAYLPNIPEAVVAMLAAVSLGAVWTSAPPEFGVKAVVDRFGQVGPRVLIAVEGYRYGGRRIDRRDHLAAIRAALPDLAATVIVPYPEVTAPGMTWDDLLAAGPEGTPTLTFEQVPFSHPLYVLYSSGTTGPPKAIVHGHGGILCEHAKALGLHHDIGPGDRFFWFSTTGWMMWNYLVSGLVVGATIVLFDGDPGHPDLATLWRLAADTGTTFFGVSAPYLEACRRAGVDPGPGLDALAAVGSTGAPLSPAAAAWATTATGRAIPVLSVSGGTDVCTGFVGGSRTLPVRAGEMACRYLGAAVEAWGDDGPVVGERGELVITAPLPSMPVGLWGDDDGSRLRAAYYAEHPGAWTHGDWITVFDDGACAISGRADATLNRGGVRLGTAEIYAVLDGLPEVADTLVVHLDHDGRDELVLFVVPADGRALDDAVSARIRAELRAALSPRHAPDRIVAVPAIPRTLSGKKLEVPIKRILSGEDPARVVDRDTLADPAALDPFLRKD